MQVFEKTINAKSEDLDELDHVNNVRYLQWVQDIAKAHWEQNVTPEILKNFFWVVVSHFIEYKGSALLNDELILKTYVAKSEGFKSTRIVEMYRKSDNRLLVKAETVWCLMSMETKRPTRITPEIANLFN
ncbi:thioesterase [Flavobacteriaceae sp. LMIT009]